MSIPLADIPDEPPMSEGYCPTCSMPMGIAGRCYGCEADRIEAAERLRLGVETLDIASGITMERSGTLRNLRIENGRRNEGATVRVNGADTSLTCWLQPYDTNALDAVHTWCVCIGDFIEIRGGNSLFASVEFVPVPDPVSEENG